MPAEPFTDDELDDLRVLLADPSTFYIHAGTVERLLATVDDAKRLAVILADALTEQDRP